MDKTKNIALVAHDNKKKDLVEWVEWNYKILLEHNLFCTGTTGQMIENVLKEKLVKENFIQLTKSITKLKSGPLGGESAACGNDY